MNTHRLRINLPRSATRFVMVDGSVIEPTRTVMPIPKRPSSKPPQPFHPPVIKSDGLSSSPPEGQKESVNLSRGEAKELADLIGEVAREIAIVQNNQAAAFANIHQLAVELALTAASSLLGTALNKDQFRIDLLIQQALHTLDADGGVKVRLHKEDLALLHRLVEQQAECLWMQQLTLIADDSLSRGTVRIESIKRTLLSDFHTRLDDIRRVWMESLDVTAA